jgi:1-aminocyclopropane-1-carboxylate deaminase/D-cysteine desulfhydrase-like pyridoxal-dependent ACC family enzyme
MEDRYLSCEQAQKVLQDTQTDVGCYVWATIDTMPTGNDLKDYMKATFDAGKDGDTALILYKEKAVCIYEMTKEVHSYCPRYEEREEALKEIMRINLEIIDKEIKDRGIDNVVVTPPSQSSQTGIIIGIVVASLALICIACFVKGSRKKQPLPSNQGEEMTNVLVY